MSEATKKRKFEQILNEQLDKGRHTGRAEAWGEMLRFLKEPAMQHQDRLDPRIEAFRKFATQGLAQDRLLGLEVDTEAAP